MSNTAYGSITVTDLVDRGISSVQGYYKVSNNTSETFDVSTWSTTILSPSSANKYLWFYEITTYSDGTTSNWGPLIIGTYGEQGSTGVGINKVQKLLYLKNSKTSAPSAPTSAITSTSTSANVWTTASPVWQTGYYYWTCYQTQKTNGTYTWSSVVLDNALNEANETALEAATLAASKSQVYYSTSNPTSGSYNTGDIWVKKVSTGTGGDVMYYYNGSSWVQHSIGTTTIIDGSIITDKIASNAITASKIASNTITANEIASGTITANELAVDAITSGNIDLYGDMTVYEDSTLAVSGGALGYMQGLEGHIDGSTTTTDGMAISSTNKKNFLIVTDAGVRMTHITNDTPPVEYDAYISGHFYTNGRLIVDSTSTHRIGGNIRLNSLYDANTSSYTMSGTTYANDTYIGPNSRVYFREVSQSSGGRGVINIAGYTGCGSGQWYVDANNVCRLNLYDGDGTCDTSFGINTLGQGFVMLGNPTDGSSFIMKQDIDAWNAGKLVHLWTNASPTSTFAAQTISMDLTNYNLFYIKFKEQSTSTGSSEFFFTYSKTTGTNVTTARWVSRTGSNIFFNSRSLQILDTGFTFNGGERHTQGSSSASANNAYMVPWDIYGMRTV